MNYWRECIKEAFDDAGIIATEEQIDTVTSWVDGAHDNYSQAHGHDCIPNPQTQEIKELKCKLEREQGKRVCPECKGRGAWMEQNDIRPYTVTCSKCHGEGWLY